MPRARMIRQGKGRSYKSEREPAAGEGERNRITHEKSYPFPLSLYTLAFILSLSPRLTFLINYFVVLFTIIK